MIKISCIVPMYNVENYLDECLLSLVSQTLSDIEIIIVNDGSTDKSLEIANKFKQNYSNIIILTKENGGLSSARNAGMKIARGEYLCFVDSDDFIDIDALEKLYSICKKNNLDIIKGKYQLFDDNRKKVVEYVKNNIHIPSENIAVKSYEYLKQALDFNVYEVIVCNSLFRREYLIKNHLFFREGIKYEDHEFTLLSLVKDNNCTIMQTHYNYYYYRQRFGSITKSSGIEHVEDICNNLNNIYQNIDNLRLNKNECKYAYKAISILINTAYFQYKQLGLKDKIRAKTILKDNIRKLNIVYSYNWKVVLKTLILLYLSPSVNLNKRRG